MDNEFLVHTHNGILLSYKKEHIRVSSREADEISQKKKHQCTILMHICRIQKDSNDNPICKAAKETHM